MRVILEGPDGAGKTTLAQDLVNHIPFLQIHHEGVPERRDLLQYYAALLIEKDDHVFDRLHVGELVYGPIVRGQEFLGGQLGLRLMKRLIVALDARVIYCLPEYEVAELNWRVKHSEKIEYVANVELYGRIYDRYAILSLMDDTTKHLVYNYKMFPPRTVREFVVSDSRVALPGVVGDPNKASTMFVGDIANHPTLDLPFFSTENSSRYLYDCLEDAGWSDDEHLMINAFKPDGYPRDLISAWVWAGYPKVVALGGRASARLKHHAIPHDKLEHPAYWKRFHGTDTASYVNRLRGIRAQVLSEADSRH